MFNRSVILQQAQTVIAEAPHMENLARLVMADATPADFQAEGFDEVVILRPKKFTIIQHAAMIIIDETIYLAIHENFMASPSLNATLCHEQAHLLQLSRPLNNRQLFAQTSGNIEDAIAMEVDADIRACTQLGANPQELIQLFQQVLAFLQTILEKAKQPEDELSRKFREMQEYQLNTRIQTLQALMAGEPVLLKWEGLS
jgi:hypothetical protein